jgi:hypothetical protein
MDLCVSHRMPLDLRFVHGTEQDTSALFALDWRPAPRSRELAAANWHKCSRAVLHVHITRGRYTDSRRDPASH